MGENNKNTDLIEGDIRKTHDENLRNFLETSWPIELSTNPADVVDFAFKLAALNFKVNPEDIQPQQVRAAFTNEVIGEPLFNEKLDLQIVKDKASLFFETLKPNTPEDIAIFYFLLLAKGHFMPDSNGRISRIIGAIILHLDLRTIVRLVSKNAEIRIWLQNLPDDSNLDSFTRFRTLYESAIKDENKAEFTRILKIELPKNLLEFRFSRPVLVDSLV